MHRSHLRNLSILILGLTAGILLYNYPPFHEFLKGLGSLGLLGAFLAGIAYDSTVTVAASVATLLVLAREFSPLQVTLVASIGAVIGDYIVFRFVKDTIMEDLRPAWLGVVREVDHVPGLHRRFLHVKHLVRTKYFHWTLPVVAAILIGSPFPNELAVGLMSTSRIETKYFLLLSFTFNFIGIFLLVSAAGLVTSR